jgi:hypothetical protein
MSAYIFIHSSFYIMYSVVFCKSVVCHCQLTIVLCITGHIVAAGVVEEHPRSSDPGVVEKIRGDLSSDFPFVCKWI